MKRISLLFATAAVSVVAVSALAAASASAATPNGVLCKTAPISHECGASAYADGTNLSATLAPGTSILFMGPFGETRASCTESSIAMEFKNHVLFASSWSFSKCEGGTVTYHGQTLGLLWKEGTDNATTQGSGAGFAIYTNFLGGEEWDGFGGPGIELIGGAPAQLKFSKAMMICTSSCQYYPPVVTGTYNITSPTPLYVEKS